MSRIVHLDTIWPSETWRYEVSFPVAWWLPDFWDLCPGECFTPPSFCWGDLYFNPTYGPPESALTLYMTDCIWSCKMVRRTLLHGASFMNQGVLTQVWDRPLSQQVSFGQIVFKQRMLDIHCNDFWHRIHLWTPHVAHLWRGEILLRRLPQNLEILETTDFLNSSFMKSRGVIIHPWCFLTLHDAMAAQNKLKVSE